LQSTVTKFWVEYRGHKIEFRQGNTVLGRSASCQIVLDDGLVSRRHAQLKVDRHHAVLEDFGSVNGVFVNGVRVFREKELVDGDVIVIGAQQLTLRSMTINLMDTAIRFAAETLHGDASLRQTSSRGEVERETPPKQAEGFAVLGNVADKVLALGRGAEAERMLSASMQAVLQTSRQGGPLPVELADEAAGFGVRLLEATRKPVWADYIFELFMNLRRPIPVAVVDQLFSVLRTVSGVDLTLLRNYVALLQAIQHSFGPTERFLVQRIEGLERIVTR
jgi:hypothetical protein